jgi:hypothetical protein
MGPGSLIVYAASFLSAAKTVLVKPEIPFDPARTYLACHSLELCIKAFLSLRGRPMVELAGGAFRHDLAALLTKAEKEGFLDMVPLTGSQMAEIVRAAKYYSEKVFEYPAVGESIGAYPHLPHVPDLIEISDLMVSALFDLCLAA